MSVRFQCCGSEEGERTARPKALVPPLGCGSEGVGSRTPPLRARPPAPSRPGAGAALPHSAAGGLRVMRSGPRAGAQLSHSAAGGRARPAPLARCSHRASAEPRDRPSCSHHGGQGLSLLPVRQEGQFRLGSSDGDQPS